MIPENVQVLPHKNMLFRKILLVLKKKANMIKSSLTAVKGEKNPLNILKTSRLLKWLPEMLNF